MVPDLPIRRRITNCAKRFIVGCTSGGASLGTRVIAYHSIDDTGSPISVTTAQFERHLTFLKRRGYRSLSITEYADRLRSGEAGRNEVLLTFDDGYPNFLRSAVPLLERFGFRACLFVPTDFVGQPPGWLQRDVDRIAGLLNAFAFSKHQREAMSEWVQKFSGDPLMDWKQIREVRDRGFDVQSHTAGHHFLAALSPGELCRDLKSSFQVFTEQMGAPPIAVCYPYGDCNRGVSDAAAQAGFSLGFLSVPAARGMPLEIGRTQIGGDDACDAFSYALSPVAEWATRGRRMLARWRGRT